MTWEELQNRIAKMTPEQKKMNVTVFDFAMDEFLPGTKVMLSSDEIPEEMITTSLEDAESILGENSPFLLVNYSEE